MFQTQQFLQSCETGVYCQHEKSQVVQTAWAVLSLMAADYPDKAPIERGIKLVMSRQQPNGEWLQEAIEGETYREKSFEILITKQAFSTRIVPSHIQTTSLFSVFGLLDGTTIDTNETGTPALGGRGGWRDPQQKFDLAFKD